MSEPRHSIFIRYRRVDSVYAVDRLDEWLKRAFGLEAVFRDASSIAPGAVFPDPIRDALLEARFREAEQMQTERQPEYPLLYSVQGFQYCDLLLAARSLMRADKKNRDKKVHEKKIHDKK